MKKRIFTLITALLLTAALLAGCSGGETHIDSSLDEPAAGNAAQIVLDGDKADISGRGLSASGSIVTIKAAGDYEVSGKLSDGQIIVNTGDDPGRVRIILNNADLTNLRGDAIYVQQAKELRIYLAEGSVNRLCSGTEADMERHNDDSKGGAIHSDDDMDIEGEGSLEICGYINNGISCKNDIDINGGNITVTAANNGIKGSDSVEIKGGNISITSQNDGIKSSTSDKDGKGFVRIKDGTVAVFSQGDGISAETELKIEGGTLNVTAQGNPKVCSSKAMKAGRGISIEGGVLNLSSSDHTVRCDADIRISGGDITASSEGISKCISADGGLDISGGNISVNAGDDGLEARSFIKISGGNIDIMAGHNGIKGGRKSTGFEKDNGPISIEGGDINIRAFSDAIESGCEITVSGGTVFGIGNSSVFRGFSDSSTQPFIALSVDGKAGDTVSIGELVSGTAEHNYNTVLYSSPSLQSGTSYTVTAGSSSTETAA